MFNILLRFVICVLIWFRKITRLVHLRLISVFRLLMHLPPSDTSSAFRCIFCPPMRLLPLGFITGNPWVTRRVPAPTPAWNPYPCSWVWVLMGMGMGTRGLCRYPNLGCTCIDAARRGQPSPSRQFTLVDAAGKVKPSPLKCLLHKWLRN